MYPNTVGERKEVEDRKEKEVEVKRKNKGNFVPDEIWSTLGDHVLEQGPWQKQLILVQMNVSGLYIQYM